MSKLLPRHFKDLRRSRLSDDTIAAPGFYTPTNDEVERILGFNAGEGLVIPYRREIGDEPFYTVKPDRPCPAEGQPGKYHRGKLAKYLSPRWAAVKVYVLLRTRRILKEAHGAFVILTGGEKKAAKAYQEGFPYIGLGAIWSNVATLYPVFHTVVMSYEQIRKKKIPI